MLSPAVDRGVVSGILPGVDVVSATAGSVWPMTGLDVTDIHGIDELGEVVHSMCDNCVLLVLGIT